MYILTAAKGEHARLGERSKSHCETGTRREKGVKNSEKTIKHA